MRIVADQIMCPTPAKAIAETVLQMLLNPHSGYLSLLRAEPSNWYLFAKLIVENARALNLFLAVKHVQAITTAEYPMPAKRPPFSVLNCGRITDVFGIQQPDWKQGLTHVITQLFSL